MELSSSNKRALFFNMGIVLVAVLVLLLLLAPIRPAQAIAGRASYYTTYQPSACYGFDPLPSDNNFAAANPSIYGGGAACGSYYNIRCTGNGCINGGGPITVKIVDLCPGCASNQFDLSQEAFAKIANLDVGVIDIDYTRA